MLDTLPQLLVNGLIAASIYLLIALGLTMIFGVLDFVNFAHGDMAVAGAYIFYTFYAQLNWPLLLALLTTAVITGCIGVGIEYMTFRPVRTRPKLVSLLTSVGVSFIISSLLLIFFGPNARNVRSGEVAQRFNVLGATITDAQIIIISIAGVLVVGLYLFLSRARLGKAMRAVADNHEVAGIVGIPVNRVISAVFFIGSALAAIGGSLLAFEQSMNPAKGIPLSVVAFSAIVLGGVGSISGAVVGALVYGLAENVLLGIQLPNGVCELFSEQVVTCSISAGYKDAIAFVVLILMLLLRPQGILGAKKEEEIRA